MVASGRGQHIHAWKKVRRRRGEKPKGGKGRGGRRGGFFCHYLNLGKKEIKHWGKRFWEC